MAQLNVNRGTTYTLGYQHQHDGINHTLVGATVRFTVKDKEYDGSMDDSTALVKKDVAGDENGYAVIVLSPTDTANLTPGKLFYDIKVKEASGSVFKMDEGKIKIDGSPTNRLS